MKKLICIIILLSIFMLNIKTPEAQKKEETRAIFISYIELNKYVKDTDHNKSKKNIDKMINNIKNFNFNTIILQVRTASDAIYPSKIYPYSSYVAGKEGEKYYDVLAYFLNKCHQNNLKLFAWINPYRVRTTADLSTITSSNPAYQYIGSDTLYVNDGIFYNPAKKEVVNLIVNGVKEVLKYKVDGVVFDDYFYPDKEIDEKDYQNYLKTNPYIDPHEFRLNNVNKMIKKVYNICQEKNVPFGVSPDGNIENNYNKNYADVKKWLSKKGYINFIMPQIYYGFYNSARAYTKALEEWESLLTYKKIDLYVALAFYKVGTEDKYAKEGSTEWMTNDDIIMREILLSRNAKNYCGFALFRYDNIFDTNNYTSTSIKEIENMKKILK